MAQRLTSRFGIVAGCLLALGLTGCGTILNLGVGVCPVYSHPRIYGATRIDLVHILPENFPLGLGVALLDLPFSLAFDTLWLPCSIPATIREGDKDPWPEGISNRNGHRSRPVLRGKIIEGATPGFTIVLANQLLHPLPGDPTPIEKATITPLQTLKGIRLSAGIPEYSSFGGLFTVSREESPSWGWLRFACPGYRSLEIPISGLHPLSDAGYWEQYRVLIRLTKE